MVGEVRRPLPSLTDPGARPGEPPRRVLLYSHDTFGLGHVRRARAIANALVEGWPGLSVLILSGCPVIGEFEFSPGVDYVRVPGVTKLADGDYRSLTLNVPLDEAVGLREALIRRTAEVFQPDLLIADKEPTGFRGELLPTLALLRRSGCRLVLGLRDILDEAEQIVPEWERKGAGEALKRFYDEVWVYGRPEIHEPLAALRLGEEVGRRIHYTGYLRRDVPRAPALRRDPALTRQPFILVTTGGGGDGDDLVDWVISAYEADPAIELPALVVFGPFIGRDRRGRFLRRIARNPKLDAIAFDSRLELIMKKAEAVVAMGGYNTFCEILSLDQRALLVPRMRPRREQHIRAVQAERLGLARMLAEDGGRRDPGRMAAALRALPGQPRPSQVAAPGLLDGLDAIRARVAASCPLRHVAE